MDRRFFLNFHPSIGQIGMENQQKQLAKEFRDFQWMLRDPKKRPRIRTCGCFQGLEGPSFCLVRGRLTVHKDSLVLNMAIFRRKSDLSEAATFTNLRGTWVRIPISKVVKFRYKCGLSHLLQGCDQCSGVVVLDRHGSLRLWSYFSQDCDNEEVPECAGFP